uniref:F-box domain-containing protein n=1 Tax=Mycena chlorophos TaxID=658473 RepID=A0ABQ0M101_MYCCL|nr:predicted protein [Mycena chlorophos]
MALQLQNPHSSSLYPVLTLPAEIVAQIFMHYLPAYPNRPPLRGNGSPTRLSHICQLWREIAIATPQLWRAISFSVSNPDLVESFLKRSHLLPISINIDIDLGYDMTVAPLLLEYSGRWEYAAVRLDSVPPELAGQKIHLPLASHLEVQDFSGEDSPEDKTLIFAAPQLRTLSCRCFRDQTYLGHFDKETWASLTVLSIGPPARVVPILQILSNTKTLAHCSIEGLITFTEDHWHTGMSISLPKLQSLILSPDRYSLSGNRRVLPIVVEGLQHLAISEKVFGVRTLRLESLVPDLLQYWNSAPTFIYISDATKSTSHYQEQLPHVSKLQAVDHHGEEEMKALWKEWSGVNINLTQG